METLTTTAQANSLACTLIVSNFDRFLQHLQVVKNASEHTVRNYSNDLKALLAFLEDRDILDKSTLREFLADLTEKRLAKRSIARRLSCIRSFFSFFRKKSLLN